MSMQQHYHNGNKVQCSYSALIKTNELVVHDRNPNHHSDDQVDVVSKLIDFQGWRHPIIVSKMSGKIVAGHCRLLSAKKLGLETVPVDYQDFESAEAEYAFLVSDNSSQGWSVLDLSAINLQLGDLGPDFDIDLLGIKDFVLEPADKLDPQCDEDDPAEPKETRSKPGDLWKLGNHRLMCGDSTMIDSVEKLMAGEKAVLCFTDPPYGVNYQAKNKMLNSLQPSLGRLETEIHGDDMSLDQLKEMVGSVFKNIYLSLANKSSYYVCAPQGGELGLMMMMMQEAGLPCRHMIIWVKNNAAFSMGRLDYDYRHEPILYGWSKGKTHEFIGGGEHKNSVWEIDRENNKLHPTMKPVAIMRNAIKNSTTPGDLVIDFFGGSGSTLIAAEAEGRRCNTMEILPMYADVILSRWENYTGKQAEIIQ